MPVSKKETIQLRGVRQNNLKGFDLDLPIGQLTVVTGLSGAGKSSLVFQTLHAEGQRRYVETFSPYTRQFMELLDRPKVESVHNIRPSIAIEQSNTVKTSRSTVGTITELCDYFKVWFANHATLFDPATNKPIRDDNPQSVWRELLKQRPGESLLLCFAIQKPEKLSWTEVLQPLSAQGYARVLISNSPRKKPGTVRRIDALLEDKSLLPKPKRKKGAPEPTLFVIQDRIKIAKDQRSRFVEAAQQAFSFGRGRLHCFTPNGHALESYTQGLYSPTSGQSFRPATPALFSFNSPIGACPTCRGFGRVIEIDDRLVIPDTSLSIDEGAIRAFQGEVYSESLRDLQRAAARHGIPTDQPFDAMSEKDKAFVMEGEPDYDEGNYERQWYGVRRFFDWLESKVYRMHVRVFLSKFRSYNTCPDCHGARLKTEALNWKWEGHTLPDLYRKSVAELLKLFNQAPPKHSATQIPNHPHDSALTGILSRLSFLEQVGLDYLSLDRSSRTLSGGETMRVNLTSCLGSALTDTLFVLDEPSVGLHARDMDQLIGILRSLTDLGNTVVVVEHDEAIMRAADHLIEIGPEPGRGGGQLTFSGNYKSILKSNTHTGRFLSGRDNIEIPTERRPVAIPTERRPVAIPGKSSTLHTLQRSHIPTLSIYGASKHNISKLDLHIPQQRLVCLSGVSGSGKSTVLNNVIYQNLMAQKGQVTEDPAALDDIESSLPVSEIVLVDQSPASKTPRSNPALFTKAWDEIRKLFAQLEAAQRAGMLAGHFSFNGGDGRCTTCSGLGYEQIEMQFVSDVFVPCESCEGRRFKNEVLSIEFNGKSIADILELDVDEAVIFFDQHPKVVRALQPLIEVGLGYLKLGQPLNTLSGGESQRLKLVRYLGRLKGRGAHPQSPADPRKQRAEDSPSCPQAHATILIDEPTTGLHRADVKRLIGVLQKLVDAGNSLIVIEHNLDVLKVADWIIEMGPEAGKGGGRVVAQGEPEQLCQEKCETGPYLHQALKESHSSSAQSPSLNEATKSNSAHNKIRHSNPKAHSRCMKIQGAREHNLKNVSVEIPHSKTTVITGVSGSGKSSLAFDVAFAEGQRRFMESMSAYARQFVEQMSRAEVDELSGIAPTVAIEQRVTKGTRKSTVATITEVAQYLRLLYARIGVQHSPTSGEPVVSQSEATLHKRLKTLLQEQAKKYKPATTNKKRGSRDPLLLCAPLIRGRKGHHEPIANWARDRGYGTLRIDGRFVSLRDFKKLDRYREHDIDLVVADLSSPENLENGSLKKTLNEALRLGKGSALLLSIVGEVVGRLSTTRTDPTTGEAFPELDPKHFSWNSPRGWCPTCRGYGQIFDGLEQEEDSRVGQLVNGTRRSGLSELCPDCEGARLNLLSRSVRLPLKKAAGKKAGVHPSVSLPELLALTPTELLTKLQQVRTNKRSQLILGELIPEIEERMRFMDRVGLGYLQLNRPTATLSGGEAQRIRLAAQLSSNLSGVLYVLDEPSIGLHASDNEKLLKSLEQLRNRGNTLVVVEHNESTMRHADRIIDLGPGAGIHGGEIVASGTLNQVKKSKRSLTAKYLREAIRHPSRGHYRELPPAWSPRKRKGMEDWIVLRGAALRNLKGFDLAIPKNRLTVVCGVSGAGKSTLIRDLLKPLVEDAIREKTKKLSDRDVRKHRTSIEGPSGLQSSASDFRCSTFHSLSNAQDIRKVIEVDHSPIGKTTRSTPATYIGAFDTIREIFASLPEANMQGYNASSFSFNTKGGRCETCKGAGRVKLEMNFMPDTYVTCEDCNGRRYGAELDPLRWHGKNIADVLEMSFEEAAKFFSFHSQLNSLMDLMVEAGLGYITLGQYSPTLSGGEAQRMKLVSELAKGQPSFRERQYNQGRGNLYILEEPTIGLHLADVERLAQLLHRLVDNGHSVILIEHHLELIREADYVVEIGPSGGEAGGELVYQGPLEGLKEVKQSATASYL